MREKVICLSFILFVFLFGIAIQLFRINENAEEKYVNVSVKGAVMKSGTYLCRYGISVAEVLEMSGGMRESGYLPEGFDYNTPITEDTIINIPNRYSIMRNNFEEN